MKRLDRILYPSKKSSAPSSKELYDFLKKNPIHNFDMTDHIIKLYGKLDDEEKKQYLYSFLSRNKLTI